MKPSELKEWMKTNNKTVVDVASLTQVSPKTIERFLKKETEPSPLVLAAFKRLLAPEAGSNQ